MADQHAAFVGSVPENYDRYLGSIFFHGFADDLAARLAVKPGVRVLEIACGTGIVTERLARRLAGVGSLVATDLNEPMLAYARSKGFADAGVTWRTADGTALPFDDAAFDAVVCQFGLMFFPDKAKGVREAWRVLRPGGHYLFNVWDAIAHNPVARITHETVATFFPADPPQFYATPFSLHDASRVREWLTAAGFEDTAPVSVTQTGTSPSAADAVIGLIDGNPIVGEINARTPDALADVKAAVARNLVAELGDRPVRCPLRAWVFSARKR
jgi:ubiquinone/menaquinone biosynthesis C-methylase UbiE